LFTIVRLTATEWLAAYRHDGARLQLPMPAAPHLGQRVAVRVKLVEPPVEATLVGSVASVSRQEGHHRVELTTDADSLQAARMLATAARGGGAGGLVPRAVRYLMKIPVLVPWNGGEVYATTLSVSSGGCALRWAGAPPPEGSRLRLRIGTSPRSVALIGEVVWTRPGASTSTAGVRFITRGPEFALSTFLAEAERRKIPRS
jgi:hypothetical protein